MVKKVPLTYLKECFTYLMEQRNRSMRSKAVIAFVLTQKYLEDAFGVNFWRFDVLTRMSLSLVLH